jgi:hypothetical protein
MYLLDIVVPWHRGLVTVVALMDQVSEIFQDGLICVYRVIKVHNFKIVSDYTFHRYEKCLNSLITIQILLNQIHPELNITQEEIPTNRIFLYIRGLINTCAIRLKLIYLNFDKNASLPSALAESSCCLMSG